MPTTLSAVGMPQSRKVRGHATHDRIVDAVALDLAPAGAARAGARRCRRRRPRRATRAMFSAMPQPTSLTITGTSTAAATSPIGRSARRSAVVPSGCSASWSGFAWSTSASASIMRTTRRQRSMPSPARAAARRRGWRAAARRGPARAPGRSRPAPASSRAARCEPTPIATPAACAAAARRRLISRAALAPRRSCTRSDRRRQPAAEEVRGGVDGVEVELRAAPGARTGSARGPS